MNQFIIWYANQPYVCGAGLDGDIYDTEEWAQEMLWMTARDGAGCIVLPYIECAEGQTPPDPTPPGGYQAGFYQTDDGQVFHVNGRDMDQKTMDALQAMVKAAARMIDRGDFPTDGPTTQERIATLMDEVALDEARARAADHTLGDPVHLEAYSGYTIAVWTVNDGRCYAEIDNGRDNGAAQGLYDDIESAVRECRRMIDHPYGD